MKSVTEVWIPKRCLEVQTDLGLTLHEVSFHIPFRMQHSVWDFFGVFMIFLKISVGCRCLGQHWPHHCTDPQKSFKLVYTWIEPITPECEYHEAGMTCPPSHAAIHSWSLIIILPELMFSSRLSCSWLGCVTKRESFHFIDFTLCVLVSR